MKTSNDVYTIDAEVDLEELLASTSNLEVSQIDEKSLAILARVLCFLYEADQAL